MESKRIRQRRSQHGDVVSDNTEGGNVVRELAPCQHRRVPPIDIVHHHLHTRNPFAVHPNKEDDPKSNSAPPDPEPSLTANNTMRRLDCTARPERTPRLENHPSGAHPPFCPARADPMRASQEPARRLECGGFARGRARGLARSRQQHLLPAQHLRGSALGWGKG